MNYRKFNGRPNIIADIISLERTKQNLSLSQLSDKLQLIGVCLYKSDLYLIENNKRSVKDFELIALAIVLHLDYKKLEDIILNIK